MIVSFCGHGNIYQKAEVGVWLAITIEALIENGAEVFYLGGYGDFDSMARLELNRQKNKYPHIQRVLILACLNRRDNHQDEMLYDWTIYPPLEDVPLRFSIARRNQWMVDRCDVMVSYVTHDWGGASKTQDYARRKGKRIIGYCKE